MALSCEELHEQITAYVDNEVSEEKYRQRVASHIESCSLCREEYEREIMTKMIIRQRFPRVGTPAELRSSIEGGIAAISPMVPTSRRYSSASYSRRKSPQRSIFLLLIVIAGLATYILLFNDSSDPKPLPQNAGGVPRKAVTASSPRKMMGPVNPFNFAMENFEKVEAGTFALESNVGDFTQLKSYFSQKGISSLSFPGLSLPLKGGTVITQDGVPLPQLVYSDGKASFYLFEISWENAQAGKGAYLTEDVAQKLKAGETIWTDVPGGGHLALYKNGDVVETVVSNQSEAEMKKKLGLAK